MKILRFAAVGVAAALTLAACGNGDDSSSSDTPSASKAPEAATIKLWLNGTDTPDALREYLTTTFEAQNPGSKLVIEQQDWTGLVPRLQTALASADQTPGRRRDRQHAVADLHVRRCVRGHHRHEGRARRRQAAPRLRRGR